MRRAPVLLLVLLGPALAAGQESARPDAGPPDGGHPDARELDNPEAAPLPPPAASIAESLLPGAEDIGIGFFLGVAACRSGSYAEDPLLQGLLVSGNLLESSDEVSALFNAEAPGQKKGRFYTEQTCRDLRALATLLRYHLELRERPEGRGVALELVLRPMTLVRTIEVRGNAGLFELRLSPVYREEILRRLKLRPGASLEEDPERRRLQLADEEQRVRAYLVRRGFFDAQVKVEARAGGSPYQAELRVDIDKGAGYTVGKVGVEGNTAVENEIITDIMGQRICILSFLCFGKDRFEYEELKTDLDRVRAIYQGRGYPGVRVSTSYNPSESADRDSRSVRFKVMVRERKKITVTFDGNRSKEERTLRGLLTFDEAGAYDDIEAQNSAENIRRSYQGNGRFLTTVSFERERLSPTPACPACDPHDSIIFHIDEGPEQRVRSLGFRGNRAFTVDQLRSVIVTKPYPRFRYLFGGGGYVTNTQLAQDVQRLIAVYRQDGYAQVQVAPRIANRGSVDQLGAVAAQVTAGDSGDGLHISFDIVEGTRELVEAVEHSGNQELGSVELTRNAALLPGKPFTDDGLSADSDLIRRRYRDRGYLYVKVTPSKTGSGAAIRVHFAVEEGLRVRTGKVLVRGNFKTRRWVIRDALGLEEGGVLSARRLDVSQAALRATDLFANIPPPVPVGRDPMNLVIDVEERYDNILDFRLAGGYSTDNSIFLTGTTDFHSLGGIGVSLGLNGEIGLQRQRAQATLGFPQWVMKKAVQLPMRAELQARYRSENTERFGDLETVGFGASLSRQLAQGVLLSLRYDWNRFGRSTDLIRPPGADQDLTSLAIRTTTAALGPVLLVDRRRPSALLPTSGYVAQAQLQLASRYLLGTDDFLKLTLGGQLFIPLANRFVISNTVRYDQGFFPFSDAVLLPEVERFTAGGDTTVRGIAEDRLATEIIANPLLPAADATAFRLVPAGGNIRFLYKLDVQARLYDFSDAFSLASAVFLDNGFIANSFFRFDFARRFRHSLGLALRLVFAPVLSVSVEYAFPLDPTIGDDPTGRLHFNLGITF